MKSLLLVFAFILFLFEFMYESEASENVGGHVKTNKATFKSINEDISSEGRLENEFEMETLAQSDTNVQIVTKPPRPKPKLDWKHHRHRTMKIIQTLTILFAVLMILLPFVILFCFHYGQRRGPSGNSRYVRFANSYCETISIHTGSEQPPSYEEVTIPPSTQSEEPPTYEEALSIHSNLK